MMNIDVEIGDIVNVEAAIWFPEEDRGILLWKTDKDIINFYDKILKYYSFSSNKIQTVFSDEFLNITIYL